MSDASRISILEYLPHSSEVFDSHSSFCCHQETSDLAEVDLKLLPSLKKYLCYASYYLCYDYEVSLTTFSVQLHMYAKCNKLYGVHPNTS